MAAGPAELLLFSAIDLLKGSLFVSIPVFAAVFAGKLLRKKIAEKTKWKWLASSLAATFIIVSIAVAIAYFYPVISALGEQKNNPVPSSFATPLDVLAASYVYSIYKIILSSAVISILLIPLELIGLYIFESISKKYRKTNEWLLLGAAVYIASVVSSAILLFIFPEAVSGLIYFIYFG